MPERPRQIVMVTHPDDLDGPARPVIPVAMAGRTEVTLSIATSPAGATLRYPGGEAVTPAMISLPRSTETVVLHLSRGGMAQQDLKVVPDAPRSYFVPLTARGTPEVPLSDWARGAIDEPPGPQAQVDRLIDSYLDVRLRGCCRRMPGQRCGHLMLDLVVGPDGRVQEAQAHLVPPHGETTRCIEQVLGPIRDLRFTAPRPRGSAQRFVRSYDFDARE